MFCYKCGTGIPDGAAFCHKCGAKMPDKDMDKKMSDSSFMVQKHMVQKQQDDVLSEVFQDNAVTPEQNIEAVKALRDKGDDFREFVNSYVQKNTEFQSAEELLSSRVSSRFVRICYGVFAVLAAYVTIYLIHDEGLSKEIIMGSLACIFIALLIGYAVVHMVGGILKNKYASKFSGEIDGHVEADELIQFLNEKLAYLSPYFHEWGYLKEYVSLNMGGVSVAKMDITSNSELALCTEFGEKKSLFSLLYIRPDVLNRDSGQMKYICNVKLRNADIRCEKYACAVKTAPILQAAVEYYLKEYKTEGENFPAVSKNLKNETITDNDVHQTSGNEMVPASKSYGGNIKPYYCEQFDRIASGQKPKFNWTAFFLNGWMQLYNGCTNAFCKTFLPWLIAYFIVSLISIASTLNFNMALMGITSVLGILLGIGGIILCFVNGFKFNGWFYQDVVSNPEKKRSKKGVWILIAAEIAAMAFLRLVPDMLTPSYNDSIEDLTVGLPEEDSITVQSEDAAATTSNESAKLITADEAEKLVQHWLIDHPIYPEFQSMLSSLEGEVFDNEGNDSWKFDLWLDGEEYAGILVNKEGGRIIIEYSIWNENDRTFTSDQLPLEQWYTDVYLMAAAGSTYECDEDEKAAREVLLDWFDRHPLMHDIRIQFMNGIADAGSDGDKYPMYKMYADGEESGIFYVNLDNGDMVMDSVIDSSGNQISIQMPIEQWYLEYYWGWTDDSGYYSELYEDDIYNVYDEMGNPILEYYAENDSYAICDFDGQCFIEYDDGSAASETSILDFMGTYAYDGSFEEGGMSTDFYYSLEIGNWDGYCFSVTETWRGNILLQEEWVRPKSLVVNILIFDIAGPDGAGYETHSLTYMPAKDSPMGQDVVYLDGDDTMPFIRE